MSCCTLYKGYNFFNQFPILGNLWSSALNIQIPYRCLPLAKLTRLGKPVPQIWIFLSFQLSAPVLYTSPNPSIHPSIQSTDSTIVLHLSLTWYFFGLNDIRSEIISDSWPIVQYSKIRSRWFPLLAILVKTNERLGVQNWNIFEFSASAAFRIWKLLSSKGLALSGAITLKELRWGFSRAGLSEKKWGSYTW